MTVHGDRINLPDDNNVPGRSMSTQFERVEVKIGVNRRWEISLAIFLQCVTEKLTLDFGVLSCNITRYR